MGISVGTSVLAFTLLLSLGLPGVTRAADKYEESLKQLAESVTAEALKAKKQRLAFLGFTDAKGQATPIGEFLAEEVGTQVLVAGELNVVERRLVQSTLKKFHVAQVDSAHAKAVRRAAKAMRADVFLSGSYLESSDGLLVTIKLVSPSNVHVVGAARGTLPKAGPLAEMLKEPGKPAPAALEGPKEAPTPTGLGFHRNESYELIVQSLQRTDRHVKLDVTIENRSPRDLKILCLLQETLLKDDHGAAWVQGIEENRDGLCTRGLELAPREKARAVLTFTAPAESSAFEWTLHYREKSPRRDATFAIDRLRLDPGPAAGAATP
jgi:TolB-like protein